jgi:hypothetical protein
VAGARAAAPGLVAGLLRRWTAPAEVEAAPAPAAPAPPVPDAARRAFAAAYRLACEVLEYVTPRLGLVRVALEATGLPARRRALAEIEATLYFRCVQAEVPEAQLGFMPPLTMLLYEDDQAVRRVHVALTGWNEAEALHADAVLVDRALAEEPASPGPTADLFDVGRYRAALFPVSHLHVAFAPFPWLRDLFPAPRRPPR